jgi:hypothetical protein
MENNKEQLDRINDSIDFLILCIKNETLKPDRSWKTSMDALIKRARELRIEIRKCK